MKHFADLASLRQWALSSLILLAGLVSWAQDIAMGTWRTHFSYQEARHLAITDDKIFCASENGFFSRELAAGSIRKLSKIDGLSDVGVSALKYNSNLKVLVIGYRSGYVDFVFEDKILSISDIAESSLDVDKSINDIAFKGSHTFLATDLGVIVIRTHDAAITENFVQIGSGGDAVEVLEIEVLDNSLFIRTEEGVQSGSLNTNLLDFESWNMYAGSGGYTDLTLVGNDLYVVSSGSLMRLSGEVWQDTGHDLPAEASRIFESEGELLTAGGGSIYNYAGAGFTSISPITSEEVNDVELRDGTFFLADGENGLVDASGTQLSPTGPWSDEMSNFRVLDNQVYAFHAPSPFAFTSSEQQDFYSLFAEGDWTINSIDGFTNVSDVANYNGNRYFSSIGYGLYDETGGEVIQDIPGSSVGLDTMITALASGDRLFVSSFGNTNPIHTLTEEGWQSFSSITLFEDEFLTIDLSEVGVAWLGSASGAITAFEPTENQAELINTSVGLPSFFIDIDISVEDNAWVATARGPALFPDASFIFSNADAILPTFENRVLFKDEQVNAVMTDGGNRIWFGTNSGLWVYDENTSEQVAVFNEENSPLPSNQIIQLDYNGTNGEVFILTDEGMVSYRSASSVGSRTHRNVNIFPNPVRPSYQGLVGLTGLARNASVKVTDINGNLVKEVNSNGGSASWDLKDQNGSDVQTGIYLFFSSTSDGEETYVGKIAVVR